MNIKTDKKIGAMLLLGCLYMAVPISHAQLDGVKNEFSLNLQKQQEEAAKRHKEEQERLQWTLKEAQERAKIWKGPIEKEIKRQAAKRHKEEQERLQWTLKEAQEQRRAEELSQKQELERQRLEDLKKQRELERARLEEERKLAEEKRRLDEEERLQEFKKQQEVIEKIGSLYRAGIEQYDQGLYEEARATFNQILDLDPAQERAKDYVDRKIPKRLKHAEEAKMQIEQERTKLKEMETKFAELKAKEELEKERLGLEKQKLEEERIKLEEEKRKIETAKKIDRFAEQKRQEILERQCLEEERKLAEERRARISSLYKQAKDLYSQDQFSDAISLFNQILSLDPSQREAIDYLDNKIPARQAQLEQERLRKLEEQRRAEELRQKQEQERARLEDLKKQQEAERVRLEEERKLFEEKRRLEEEERLEEFKKQQEVIEKIGSLYHAGIEQYDQGLYEEAGRIFNQILDLDPSQERAKDYVDRKIPGRLKQAEELKMQTEQERTRLKEMEKKFSELRAKEKLESERLELERQKLEEDRIKLEEEKRKIEIAKVAPKVAPQVIPVEQKKEKIAPEVKKEPQKPTAIKAIPKKVSEEEMITKAMEEAGEGEEYRVKPFDTLSIKIYQEDDLSGDYRIQKGGFIDIPLLRKVQVEGMTVYEIEEKITVLLAKDYLASPQVMVSVREYHAEKIIVLGQVAKPGTYSLSAEEPVTLLRAISMAGGFTNIAAINGVKIIRMEKGKKQTMTIKCSAIIDGKQEDVVLKPGDIIVVPESFW